MPDKRLKANVKLDDRQKGFVPLDGCFENVKILQNIIKQQGKKKPEYNIVFLHLAKAVDLVSHQSIQNGLKRKGIPETVIERIMYICNGSTTKISVGGQTTLCIEINSGVKQRCSLFPLLFNLIMDELLDKLKRKNFQVQVGDELITAMAFTDALVLITEHNTHMAIALHVCEQSFG